MALASIVADRRRRADGSCIEPPIAMPETTAISEITTRISTSVKPSVARPKSERRSLRGLCFHLGDMNIVLRAFLAIGPSAGAGDLVDVTTELVRAVPGVLQVETRIEKLLFLQL